MVSVQSTLLGNKLETRRPGHCSHERRPAPLEEHLFSDAAVETRYRLQVHNWLTEHPCSTTPRKRTVAGKDRCSRPYGWYPLRICYSNNLHLRSFYLAGSFCREKADTNATGGACEPDTGPPDRRVQRWVRVVLEQQGENSAQIEEQRGRRRKSDISPEVSYNALELLDKGIFTSLEEWWFLGPTHPIGVSNMSGLDGRERLHPVNTYKSMRITNS